MARMTSGGQPSGYRNKAAQMTGGGQPAGYRNKPAAKAAKAANAVSQATIDRIKGDGMAAALKKAASSATKNTNASYVEGVKRVYGATRLNAAKAKMVSGGQPAGYRNKPAQATGSGQPAGYRNRAAQTKKASTSYSPAPMSAAAKKKAAKDGKFLSAYSKAKQAKDPYLVKREKEIKAAAAKKASTSYSPAPMSAERKKYAGFRAKYIDVLSKNRDKTPATRKTGGSNRKNAM
jgi:hypothetical protein